MHHILLSLVIITLSLLISIKRNGIESGYLTLVWVPTALLLVAFLYEKMVGSRRFSEVAYHFAYDTSYLFLIAGIVMLLHAVIYKRPKKQLLIGCCVSALPLISLMISPSR